MVGAIAVFGATTTSVLHYVVTSGFVYLVVVVGLYAFVGTSGIVSFGHIAFMGIGAYAAAVVSVSPPSLKHLLLPALPHWLQATQLGLVASCLVGGGAALVFAAAIAFPILRVSGLAASIAMFAVLVAVNVVESNWTQVTRGTSTMLGVPTDTTLGVAFVAAVVAIWAAYALDVSHAGLRLKASRDDEFAARSIGISIARARFSGFALSSVLVGVGGALYAHLLGAFSPSDFYLDTTFLTIVMLVVGGMQSLTGAVVGTIVVSAFQELLTHVENGINLGLFRIPARPGVTQLGLAVVVLLILVFRPSGITGGHEIPFPAVWRNQRLR
jgi:branched-chain amino acid transport system permease protein